MVPSDPLYAQQWHFVGHSGGIDDPLGDIQRIWDEFTGAGIHVGVYDSGVQSTHPDLAANYDASLHVEFGGVTQSGDPDLGAQGPDTVGHGTSVAGIIAAGANNGTGGVGVAWGSLITSVNIEEYFFINPDLAKVLLAIEHMANLDVTNNSWNYKPLYDPTTSLDPTVWIGMIADGYREVSEIGRSGLGTLIVQGIGNDDLDAQGSGLNVSRFTVTVAGAGPDGFAADYSNYGACVLVTAPTAPTFPVPTGEGLITTDITGAPGYVDGDYTAFGGTSGAGPVVTGVIALMLDANPNLGWRDVHNILAASARHTGSASGDLGTDSAHANENGAWFFNGAGNWNGGGMHFSNDYGYGLVNAYNAARMAEVWSLFEAGARTSSNEEHWGPWSILVPQAIPDANGAAGVLSSVLPVDDAGSGNPNLDLELEHVTVKVDLTHSSFSQLRIFLVSPDGTEVELSDGSTGDTAFTGGASWTFGIDSLRGEDTFGNWTVRIEDTVVGGTGTLNSVSLDFYGRAPSSDDVYHYTDEFLPMLAVAGQSGRSSLADTNGGTDWIDAAAVTGNIALNLNAGMTTKVNGANWFSIASGTTIEHAVTGDGNDTITGNAAANRLHGMRGNDAIDGGPGNDNMFGGKGNDTYTVAQSGDVADETGGNGTDTVKASISFSLSDTIHAKGTIEHLTLTGMAAINATGNGSANTLTGNSAANTLDGLGANDLMRGMGGNDTYFVDQSGDTVDETGGSGIDLVKAAISFSLANTARVKGIVENLTLTGSAAINATGNGLGNKLVGNKGTNVIDGRAGNDTMTGAGGADTFLFAAALNAATNVDHVTDFLSGLDKLRLDASFFTGLKVGSLSKKAFFAKKGADKAKDKQDRVIYDASSGEVRFDKDGKGKAKAVLVAVLDGGPDLAHSDVIVVA